MSQINVNRIKDSNKGAPDFPSGVNVGGITSTVTLGVTNLTATNVNVSGVVTATTLDGNLLATGTPTLGLGVTINASGVNISGVATAGIVSATTLYGNGANLTGIALTIAPLNYNPAVSGVNVSTANGIGLTFNQGVKAGSGNVTLRIAGAAGTVVENFGVGNSVTYGDSDYGTTVTITPTADLEEDTVYHLNYPSGAFTNLGGDVSYVGTAYTFDSLKIVNEMWAWGWNNAGPLGLNNRTYYSSPVQIPGTTWINISQNAARPAYHSLATKTDGTLWVWGANQNGELGLNTRLAWPNGVSSPTQIPGTTWPKNVNTYKLSASGGYFSSVIKTDGTLWTWGGNGQGQLGQNNQTSYSSPTQVPGTTWLSINGGHQSMSAVKTDGTLWSWGYGEQGQLGHNQNGPGASYSSPTQIPGTTWSQNGQGIYAIYGIKTDGTLWAVGSNISGQLGQNQPISSHRSSPVQIPGTTWANVNASGNQVFATKTDGTLWAWGNNADGILGQNQAEAQLAKTSSPVQIPGTWGTGPKDLTVNYNTVGAIKADGTLWMWGDNYYGQTTATPAGAPSNRSSPVQVPGTTWHKIGGGTIHTLAMKRQVT